MLMYRSEKYSGCVARLSAMDLPPLSTRRMSRMTNRNAGRSVSSPLIERARSSGTPEFSRVDNSCVKNSTSRRPEEKEGSLSSIEDFCGATPT